MNQFKKETSCQTFIIVHFSLGYVQKNSSLFQSILSLVQMLNNLELFELSLWRSNYTLSAAVVMKKPHEGHVRSLADPQESVSELWFLVDRQWLTLSLGAYEGSESDVSSLLELLKLHGGLNRSHQGPEEL